VFRLSKSDFRVQSNTPGGIADVDFELGTNAFGTVAGSLGLDSDGNPLLFMIQLAFLPNGTAWVSAEADSSFSGQQFFDPENGDAPITGSLDDFLANRLTSALQYDATGGVWTLDQDVSLLGESFDIPTGETSFQLDYTTLQQVSYDTPEPETIGLALAGFGILLLMGIRLRVRAYSDLR
jgi:hypothetical protein